jgi:hypothetical protein
MPIAALESSGSNQSAFAIAFTFAIVGIVVTFVGVVPRSSDLDQFASTASTSAFTSKSPSIATQSITALHSHRLEFPPSSYSLATPTSSSASTIRQLPLAFAAAELPPVAVEQLQRHCLPRFDLLAVLEQLVGSLGQLLTAAPLLAVVAAPALVHRPYFEFCI